MEPVLHLDKRKALDVRSHLSRPATQADPHSPAIAGKCGSLSWADQYALTRLDGAEYALAPAALMARTRNR